MPWWNPLRTLALPSWPQDQSVLTITTVDKNHVPSTSGEFPVKQCLKGNFQRIHLDSKFILKRRQEEKLSIGDLNTRLFPQNSWVITSEPEVKSVLPSAPWTGQSWLSVKDSAVASV